MTNIETLIDQAKDLSELEMTGFIEELREHCRKNKMDHLFDDPEVDVDGLEDENDHLKKEVKELKGNMDRIRRHARAIDDLSV